MSEKKDLPTVDITAFYDNALKLLRDEINAGKANTSQGLFGILQLADIMHGGAYAAPITARPFFMLDPTQSPYYSANLQNIPTGSDFFAWLSLFFTGPTGDLWAREVLMDANVPHVLPKLLSDETFAQVKIFFAQSGTTALFQQTATGLKTLVEGTIEPLASLAKGTFATTSDVDNP